MNEQQFHFFFVISFLATGITSFLMVAAWRKRTVRGAREFALLMGACSLWTLAIGCGMISSTTQGNFFWVIVRMAMVFAAPVFWLAFALQFSNNGTLLKMPNVVFVSVLPITSLILLTTTWRHNFFLTGIDYVQVGPYLIDKVWHLGPWFWVHLVFSYALILMGAYYLLREASHLMKLFHRQATALVIGAVLPLVINVMYVFHLIPNLEVNYDPLGFVLAGIAFSFALFQYRVFDLKPVARQLLVDSMGDGMLVVDTQSRIVDLNPAALKLIGQSEKSLIGESAEDKFSHCVDVKAMLAGLGEKRCELEFDRNGKALVYDLRCTPIINDGVKVGRLCVIRDITQRKELENELETMALTDSLTGLYNRRYFFKLATQEFERAKRYHKPFSLLMIDLDDFKLINDKYGHLVGDSVLREISNTFLQILRKSDLVFRYGGDEFAVLMPETGLEKGIQVSKRLGHAVRDLNISSIEDVSLTLSQGFALFDGYEDVTLEQLLMDADQALYAAKARGKNRISISGMD